MYNPESVQENETCKILGDIVIQMITKSWPDDQTKGLSKKKKKKKKERERAYRIVDFCSSG